LQDGSTQAAPSEPVYTYMSAHDIVPEGNVLGDGSARE